MTTAAKSREREESEAGLVGEESFCGMVGLPDDVNELRLRRVFAGGHVREEVSLGGLGCDFLHDGEAGKGRIKLVFGGIIRDKGSLNLFRRNKLADGLRAESRSFRHAEMVTAGENDIAGRIINAGDKRVGLVRFDEFAGLI